MRFFKITLISFLIWILHPIPLILLNIIQEQPLSLAVRQVYQLYMKGTWVFLSLMTLLSLSFSFIYFFPFFISSSFPPNRWCPLSLSRYFSFLELLSLISPRTVRASIFLPKPHKAHIKMYNIFEQWESNYPPFSQTSTTHQFSLLHKDHVWDVATKPTTPPLCSAVDGISGGGWRRRPVAQLNSVLLAIAAAVCSLSCDVHSYPWQLPSPFHGRHQIWSNGKLGFGFWFSLWVKIGAFVKSFTVI